MSSTRAGYIPGIHTVGFDGPSETVTLSHTVRDRATFAHGALAAARWVQGKRGWFTMRDVLGIGIERGVTSMRTTWTGCGTALVTPFTRDGAHRRACDSTPRAAADRCGHALPGALRHDRGKPHALARGETSRRRARGRRGGRQGAGARRRRRLRHARGDRSRPGDGRRGRARHPVRHPVLQQADAGRPVSALSRDRRQHAAADRRLQRARPHRLQRRARHARPPRRHPQHRRGEGSVGQHGANLRGLRARALRLHRAQW